MIAANLTEVIGGTEHQLVGNQKTDGEAPVSFEEVLLEGADAAELGLPIQTQTIVGNNIAVQTPQTDVLQAEVTPSDLPSDDAESQLIAVAQFILTPTRAVPESTDLPAVDSLGLTDASALGEEISQAQESPLSDVPIDRVALQVPVATGQVTAAAGDVGASTTPQRQQETDLNLPTESAAEAPPSVAAELTAHQNLVAEEQQQLAAVTIDQGVAVAVETGADSTQATQATSQQSAVTPTPRQETLREIVEEEVDEPSTQIDTIDQQSHTDSVDASDMNSQQDQSSSGLAVFESVEETVVSPQPREQNQVNVSSTATVAPLQPENARQLGTGVSIDSQGTKGMGASPDLTSGLRPPEMASQVISAVTQVMESPDGSSVKTILLELQPAELGRLKIQVEQSAESIATHIIASELASSDLLAAKKEALQEALSELGFGNASVDISHQQHNEADSHDESQKGSFGSFRTAGKPDTGRAEVDVYTSNGLNIVA